MSALPFSPAMRSSYSGGEQQLSPYPPYHLPNDRAHPYPPNLPANHEHAHNVQHTYNPQHAYYTQQHNFAVTAMGSNSSAYTGIASTMWVPPTSTTTNTTISNSWTTPAAAAADHTALHTDHIALHTDHTALHTDQRDIDNIELTSALRQECDLRYNAEQRYKSEHNRRVQLESDTNHLREKQQTYMRDAESERRRRKEVERHLQNAYEDRKKCQEQVELYKTKLEKDTAAAAAAVAAAANSRPHDPPAETPTTLSDPDIQLQMVMWRDRCLVAEQQIMQGAMWTAERERQFAEREKIREKIYQQCDDECKQLTQKINTLNGQLCTGNETIKRLTSEVESRTEEVAASIAQADAITKSKLQLEEELEKKKTECKSLQTSNSNLMLRMANGAQHQVNRSRVLEVEKQMEQMRQNHEKNMKSERDSCAAKVIEKVKEVTTSTLHWKSQEAELRQQVTALQISNQKLTAEKHTISQQFDSVQQSIKKITTEKHAQLQQLETMQRLMHQTKMEKHALAHQLMQAHERLYELEYDQLAPRMMVVAHKKELSEPSREMSRIIEPQKLNYRPAKRARNATIGGDV